jgi:TetR/AcrR family transcriptional repressor of bet genes
MPRSTNTSIRRQEIIQGLMIVMSEVGYEGATVPLIAKAAGLTPGLIHYHFDSKQSILIGLIDHLGDTVHKRFQEFAQEVSGAAQLKAFVGAHVGLGRGADPRAVACWISIGAEALRQPEVRAQYQRFTQTQLSTLEQICTKALVEAGRSIKKKREIALGIMCAIEGAYRLLVSAPDLIVPGFAAPTITNMALALIFAQPEAKQRR